MAEVIYLLFVVFDIHVIFNEMSIFSYSFRWLSHSDVIIGLMYICNGKEKTSIFYGQFIVLNDLFSVERIKVQNYGIDGINKLSRVNRNLIIVKLSLQKQINWIWSVLQWWKESIKIYFTVKLYNQKNYVQKYSIKIIVKVFVRSLQCLSSASLWSKIVPCNCLFNIKTKWIIFSHAIHHR